MRGMNETTLYSSPWNRFSIPASIVVAGVLIAGAVLWNGRTAPAGQVAAVGGGQPQPTVDIKNVSTTGEPFIGNANAPVTIAFWSDYQCPYCKAFEVGGVPQIPVSPAMPDIIKNYVDTGKAKIVFKDFAFLGNDSITGAEYARSVWKLYPSEYFNWRTAMYVAQDGENTGFGNATSIQALTAKISGINVSKVVADVTANKAAYDTAIAADRTEGQNMGVNATPSFIIGKQLISGADPYATFQAAIDTALSS